MDLCKNCQISIDEMLQKIKDAGGGEYERGFKDGQHVAKQNLGFAAFQRGKLDQFNDAVGNSETLPNFQQELQDTADSYYDRGYGNGLQDGYDDGYTDGLEDS